MSADAANVYVQELKRRGSRLSSSCSTRVGAGGDYNSCVGISGPIVDIVNRLDDYRCRHQRPHPQCIQLRHRRKLATSAASSAAWVTKVDLTIDCKSGDVVEMQADNKIVTRDVLVRC